MAERRFSQEQFDMLMRCSEKKDMTEWNEWRKEVINVEIALEGANLKEAYFKGAKLWEAHLEGATLWGAHLEGADLWEAHLEGANLSEAHLEGTTLWGTHLEGANLRGAHLEGTNLREAHLKGANLRGAHIEGATLWGAHLEGAKLREAHLKEATLRGAHLEGANLWGAYLEGANLKEAHLKEANLRGAHLEGANLSETHLEGAKLWEAHLEGAMFSYAIVTGSTILTSSYISNETDFTGVGLDSMRIDPKIKSLLEYNIRRKYWKQWYKGESGIKVFERFNQIAKSPVRLFWTISDYGRSTVMILLTFFILTFLFAGIYYNESQNNPPGIINNLKTALQGDTLIKIDDDEIYLRCLYFSVVTMTTLGFGDMHAQPGKKAGYIYLMIQVTLGYILLGALITRLSILFTSGGPSGSFSKVKKKDK